MEQTPTQMARNEIGETGSNTTTNAAAGTFFILSLLGLGVAKGRIEQAHPPHNWRSSRGNAEAQKAWRAKR